MMETVIRSIESQLTITSKMTDHLVDGGVKSRFERSQATHSSNKNFFSNVA